MHSLSPENNNNNNNNKHLLEVTDPLYLHFLGLGLASANKNGIWQAYWLELVGVSLCAKTNKRIPNGWRAMVNITNWLQK